MDRPCVITPVVRTAKMALRPTARVERMELMVKVVGVRDQNTTIRLGQA